VGTLNLEQVGSWNWGAQLPASHQALIPRTAPFQVLTLHNTHRFQLEKSITEILSFFTQAIAPRC